MSIAEVTARISEIQSHIAAISPTATTTSGSEFAQALSAATSTATSTGSTQSAATGTVTGQQIVDQASTYIGTPYVWGGESTSGMDCSGLVQLTYKQFGIDLPRTAQQQLNSVPQVSGGLANAQPGDLLGFGSSTSSIHHVGIYIGNGKMIEAPRPGKTVRISDVYETPIAIGRVLTGSTTGSTGSTVGTAAASTTGSSQYDSYFNSAAQKYGVSANLLSAVAKAESGYNPNAVSGAGAQGLMQLMPATARSLGVTNSFDPQQSIDGAAKLLSGLLNRFGSTELALAAYNAGPGAVVKYGGVPPYQETQNYVSKIMGYLSSGSVAA